MSQDTSDNNKIIGRIVIDDGSGVATSDSNKLIGILEVDDGSGQRTSDSDKLIGRVKIADATSIQTSDSDKVLGRVTVDDGSGLKTSDSGKVIGAVVLRWVDPLAGLPLLARFQSSSPGSETPAGAYTDVGATVLASADGDAIASLKDQSGNSLNATQSTSANRPKLRFVNGCPVWRFDGSTSKMSLGTIASTSFTTVFGVLSHHTANGQLISFGDGSRAQINRSAGGGDVGMQSANGNFLQTINAHADDFHVVENYFNSGSSAIYVDGVLEASGSSGTTNVNNTSAIGFYSPNTAYLNGDIFAIYVIQGSLNSTQRATVVSYLASINPLTEQRAWQRRGQIIGPTATWENTATQEPRPIYRGTNSWAMAYTGGFSPEAIGWATSTDGLSWTKNANPIIGGGYGNESGTARGPCLVEPTPGTLELYYGVDFPNSNYYRQISTDNGATWGSKTTVLTVAQMQASDALATGYSNSFMAYDSGAGVWRLLLELSGGVNGSFTLYSATSSDRATWSALTVVTGIGFATSSGGVAETNAGWWTKEGSLYHLYYHCVSGNGGSVPTDIYHATATTWGTWTRLLGPALPRYLEATPPGTSRDNFDQCADFRCPTYLGISGPINGTWYGYYARTNNTGPSGDLVMATYTGTLASLQSQ